MNNLQKKYQEEVVAKLKEEFAIKNSFAAPSLEKIIINAAMAEALQSKDSLEKMKEQIAQISGQQPKITTAKKSISTFKLKAGDPIGIMVTLRGKRAWDFLEKFIAVVVPRIRDFRGASEEKFDQRGNYSIGLAEQTIFPQLDLSKVDKTRGVVVTFVFTKSNREKSKKLLDLLGLPFRKAES